MKDKTIFNIVLQSVQEILAENEDLETIPTDELNEDTHLLGQAAILDSLSLVSAIVNIEQNLNEEMGYNITIADERAMTQKNSPFKNIGTLVEYIEMLIQEVKQDAR